MITCFDTETTGDTETDQVIELSALALGTGHPIATTLFQPTVPMTPEARAVHHITDVELAEYGYPHSIWPAGPTFTGTPAAHNIEFDFRMIRQTWPAWTPPERHICTHRCAKHIWPDAPRYGLQVLRYYLNLNVSPAGVPHRAAYDTAVLVALVEHMLSLGHNEDDLVRMTQTPALLSKFPFGDHRGIPFNQVPMGFLQYMTKRPDLDADLAHTLAHWIDNPERKANPLLLDVCHLPKHRGTPWAEVPEAFLRWIIRCGDFDCDTHNTAVHYLNGGRDYEAFHSKPEPEQRQPSA